LASEKKILPFISLKVPSTLIPKLEIEKEMDEAFALGVKDCPIAAECENAIETMIVTIRNTLNSVS
jgi:hypothetical protein